MVSSSDLWMTDYNKGLELSEEINEMISERSSLVERGYDPQLHATDLRRKINILATLVEILQSLLAEIPGRPISEKEMNRRRGMFGKLKSKAHQMASVMNMSNFANIGSSLGSDDILGRVTGMENQEIVQFQRQVMREQDEELGELEKSATNLKHLALAVKVELRKCTTLIDDLSNHVDVSASGLKQAERSLKHGVCMSILVAVLGVFGLADLICNDSNDEE